MPKVVARSFALSVAGFGNGLHQSHEEPFGKNGIQIMNWFFPTPTFQTMIGRDKGTTGLDDTVAGFEASEAAVHYRIAKRSSRQ